MNEKSILDPCCGSRMFWHNKTDSRVVFGDIRKESYILQDGRTLNITPDIEMDFRKIPFPDETFYQVAFDPPHLINVGQKSWLYAKYGKLSDNWRDDLRKGFSECFRVLKTNGTLIFKWSEVQIPVNEILKLTPYIPGVMHRSGKKMKTHWISFLK